MNCSDLLQLILEDISKRGEGAELDSDISYAQRGKCSVPTVKRAMAELARRGLVVRRRGRKTIASQPAAMVVSGTEFSFGRSAKEHGARLFTRLLEKSCRLPNPGPEAEIEMRAQTALGLKRSQPFLVIARLRELNDRPRVIHRSYLNPINYPTTLLKDHDFQNESLMEILEKYGMLLRSRETRIRATLPTKHECEWLEVEEEPVLQVE